MTNDIDTLDWVKLPLSDFAKREKKFEDQENELKQAKDRIKKLTKVLGKDRPAAAGLWEELKAWANKS